MSKVDGLSRDELKDVYSSIEELIVVTGKVMSGFDNHKSMGLAMLLFFSESDILDRLLKARRVINTGLEAELTEDEYNEWAENDKDCWNPSYNKSEGELLMMQDKKLIWNKFE